MGMEEGIRGMAQVARVTAACPACTSPIVMVSEVKAFGCASFDISYVPLMVAENLEDTSHKCDSCGLSFTAKTRNIKALVPRASGITMEKAND